MADTIEAKANPLTSIADADLMMAHINGAWHPISFANLMKAVRGGIQVGGRNLLKNSGSPVTSSNYHIKDYELTEPLSVGEKVLITVWGSLGSGKSHFQAIAGGGNSAYGTVDLYVDSEGKATGVLTVLQELPVSKIFMYTRPQSPAATCTISKIKLERGNIATDWSPAPEDFASAWGGVIGYMPITYNSSAEESEKGGSHADERTDRRACGGSDSYIAFSAFGSLVEFIGRACEVNGRCTHSDVTDMPGCGYSSARLDEDSNINTAPSNWRERRIHSHALLRRGCKNAVLLPVSGSSSDMGKAPTFRGRVAELASDIAERKEVTYYAD